MTHQMPWFWLTQERYRAADGELWVRHNGHVLLINSPFKLSLLSEYKGVLKNSHES